MKRILLVTYGFPPVSRVQSQGAAKLARGLAELGWETHVLTVADPPTYLLDESLTATLPDTIVTHATYSLEPTRLLQGIRKAMRRRRRATPGDDRPPSAATLAARSYTSLPQGAVRVLRALFFPEEKIGWAPFAVAEARRLHRQTPFDVVLSTGPPYTSHIIARRFARRAGVPWFAVLMDPIVGCYAFPPPTPVHSWLFRRLERSVAHSAAGVAIATPQWRDEFLGRNPQARERAIPFPNSFDPALFEGPSPAPHDGFVVAYVGTFQLSIRPDDLLNTVSTLLDDPEIAPDIRVRFVSPLDPDTDAAITGRHLEGRVERTGLVSHAEAVREMRGADVLVLILGSDEASRGILTGKLPEYLAAGKPILAIAPEGVATATIRRAGAGTSVAPGDIAGVERALREMHARWRSGEVTSPDPAVVAEFDRTRVIAELDAALRTAAGEQLSDRRTT